MLYHFVSEAAVASALLIVGCLSLARGSRAQERGEVNDAAVPEMGSLGNGRRQDMQCVLVGEEVEGERVSL